MTINNEFVSHLILSGAIGMIHFWTLRGLELLDFFNHKKTEEKSSIVIVFTLINFYVYELTMSLTNRKWNFEIYYLASFVFALIAEILFLIIVKQARNTLNKYKKERSNATSYYIPTFKSIVEQNIKEYDNYLVVYTLDNKLIDHGFLNKYSVDDEGDFNFALLTVGDRKLYYDYEKFRSKVKSTEKTKVYMFVSIDQKVKIYIYKIKRNNKK